MMVDMVRTVVMPGRGQIITHNAFFPLQDTLEWRFKVAEKLQYVLSIWKQHEDNSIVEAFGELGEK